MMHGLTNLKFTSGLNYYEICTKQVLSFVDYIYLMVFIVPPRYKQRL